MLPHPEDNAQGRWGEVCIKHLLFQDTMLITVGKHKFIRKTYVKENISEQLLFPAGCFSQRKDTFENIT